MIKRIIIIALASLSCTVRAQSFSGTVFIDRNQNGRQDKGERGIKGVPVTNGDTIVVTDKQGRYELPYAEGNSLFPILPADYTMSGSRIVNANFSYMKEGNAGTADFALVRKRVSNHFRLNAVGDVQVGWVTIATVPMLSLAEATWTLSNITSIKLEKLFHSEAYELVLPQGIYTGMLFGTS